MDHQIDAVFVELIQLSVDRIITAVGLELSGVCIKGYLFHIKI
jgi:hypothetical protein